MTLVPRNATLTFSLTTVLLAACSSLSGSASRDVAPPLIDRGLGDFRFDVSNTSPAAQPWISQGLVLAYGFDHAEGARAFRHAARIAPDCAMCAWGAAYVLGPNINSPTRGDLDEARRYAQRAVSQSGAVSERDRALISAIAVRYGDPEPKATADVLKSPPAYLCLPGTPSSDVAKDAAKGTAAGPTPHALDIAYARQMRLAYERFPDDADVAALYAESLMMLTPWRWVDKKTGTVAPSAAEAVAVLRKGLEKSPNHPGLIHFLIHATEQGADATLTQASADRLVSLTPDVAHLVHMPSHIYIKTGRYADAVRVNHAALEADVRLSGRVKAQGFESLGNWDFHHLHFLWFAAAMDGQSAVAMDAARRLAAKPSFRMRAYGSGVVEWAGSIPYVALLQFERWNDVLAEPAPGGGYASQNGVWHYARGIARLRTGDVVGAQREFMALERFVATGSGDALDAARGPAKALVASLRGELLFAQGDRAGGLALMAQAVTLEENFSGEVAGIGGLMRWFHGAALLRDRQFAAAETVFRADLKAWPNNGRALQGLAAALTGQGKTAEAAQARSAFEAAWVRADVRLDRPL